MLYEVHVVFELDKVKREFNTFFKKERLHELIGRYTVRYGPPFEVKTHIFEVSRFEWYHVGAKQRVTQIDFTYREVEETKANLALLEKPIPKVKGELAVVITPPPAPTPPAKEYIEMSGKLVELEKLGAIKKTV